MMPRPGPLPTLSDSAKKLVREHADPIIQQAVRDAVARLRDELFEDFERRYEETRPPYEMTYMGGGVAQDPLRADLALPSGASLVSFVQSGTGAVADSLQGWARDRFRSVMDFIPDNLRAGVRDGTNTTDLATYLQTALDAHLAIYFPPYTYLHASTLTGRTGHILLGYGATLKVKDSTAKSVGGISFSAKTDISILGLTVDGNRANRSPGTPVNATTTSGLIFLGCTRVNLHDVIAQNAVSDNLYIGYVTLADPNTRTVKLRMSGGRLTNGYRNNCSVTGAVDIVFDGVEADTANGTAPQDGIDIEADSSSAPNEDVTLINCKSHGNTGSGVDFSTSSKRCRAINCQLYGNTLYGAAIAASTTIDTEIAACSIYSNTSHGVNNVGGRARIHHNTIIDNGGSGIQQNGSADSASISHNTVTNNLQGIIASGSNHTVEFNRSWDNTSTSGWNIDIGGSNGRLMFNKAISSLGASGCFGIRLNSTTGVALGNRASGNQASSGVQIASLANATYADGNEDGDVGGTYRTIIAPLVTTTDATTTTAVTIALSANTAYSVHAEILANDQSDANRAFYVVDALVYRAGAGAVLQSSNATVTIESDGTWNAAVTVSGNNALIRVTGAVGATVDWRVKYRVESV